MKCCFSNSQKRRSKHRLDSRMNIKKARSFSTSVRVPNECTAIVLTFRLFTLWAFSCGFAFVAAENNDSSLSSTAVVSTSGISTVISAYSSQAVQNNASFENVNSTNSSSPTSLHNKTDILTILQSSNFPVVGSTEPIALAISFVTTTTTTTSVPTSVRSLLDASSFSIVGFTEPLSLALFTSDALSNQSSESVSSSSTVVAPLSSVKVANVSSSLIFTASTSQNVATVRSLSTDTTFSSSGKVPSSSFVDQYTGTPSFVTYSSSTYVSQSVTATESARSSLQHISSQVSANLSKNQQATPSIFSSFKSYTGTGTHPETLLAHSATQNSSTVSNTVASLHTSESSSPSSSISYYASSRKVHLTTTVTNQISNDATTRFRFSSSEATVNKNSSFGASNTKTLQLSSLVSIPFVTSVSLDTSKRPESTSSYSRISLTTVVEQMSSASVKLETSRTQTTTNTNVNSSYVSLSHSAGSTKTVEPLSTVKTSLLSKSSLSYSASLNSGFSTETLAASLSISSETTANYGNTLQGVNTTSSKQSIGPSSLSGNTSSSLPFHSNDSTSIVTEFSFTESLRQTINVDITVSSSSLSSKIFINYTSNFTSASKTSTVLRPLSSEHLELTTVEFSLKSTSTSSMISNVSTLVSPSTTGSYFMQPSVATGKSTLLPNTTAMHYFSSTFNATKSWHLFSSDPSKYVNSTSQVLVTASSSLSNSTTVVKELTTSLSTSKFPATTPYVLSSYLSTAIRSSFLYNSRVTPSATLPSSSSLSMAANVSTDKSGPRLSTDVTTPLLYQSSITQRTAMSTPSSAVFSANASTYKSDIKHSKGSTSFSFKSSITPAESSYSVMGTNMSTYLSVTRSIQVSREATASLSMSIRLLNFTSKPLDASTPSITTLRNGGASSLSDLTTLSSSLFSMKSARVVSSTIHHPNESSVVSTILLPNNTVSYSPSSRKDSGASMFTQKSIDFSLTVTITRTSFSEPELSSNVQPTSTPSAVTMTTSEHSVATLMVSSNASSNAPSAVTSSMVSVTSKFSDGSSNIEPTLTLSTVSMATSKYSVALTFDLSNVSSNIRPKLSLSTVSIVSSKYLATTSFNSLNGTSNVQPTTTLSTATYSVVSPLVSSNRSSKIQHSLTLSPLSMTTSKSSFASALDSSNTSSAAFSSLTLAKVTMVTSAVSAYVSRTFSLPRESTIAVDSSILTKRESPVSGLTILSGSVQMQTYSPSKSVKATLATLGESASRSSNLSITVHERSSYLFGESSLLSTSGAGSFSQSQTVTTTLSTVHLTSTLSFRLSPSTSDVPIATASYSPFSSPPFTVAVPTAIVSATPSTQIPLSTDVVSLSSVPLSSSLRPTNSIVNVSSTSSLQAHSSSGVSMPAHSSSGVPMVTSTYVSLPSLQRPSTSEFFTTSSVFIPSGIFVRFGISVPRNQSVNNANFTKALKEGILMVYQNGSLGASPENVSISIISIKRTSDSNSSNVNVTFQVLNGSEPLAAYLVIGNIERARLSLAQAIGYEVVDTLVIVHVSLVSSFPTMSMTLSPSSSIQRINMTSIARGTLVTPSLNSTQQPRASSTTDARFTLAAKSSLQSQRFTAAKSSANVTAISSSQIYLSSDAPVATTTYLTSVSSLQSPSSELTLTSSVTMVTLPSISTSFKTVNVTHSSRTTSAMSALSSAEHSEVSSVTTYSQQTTSIAISQSRMFTATLPSANVSATLPLQTNAISLVAMSSTLRPSTTELVITSSVIPVQPGYFIRFAISVPLNKSVSDAAFQQQLERGILVAYNNGSVGGMAGNVTIDVVEIERSSTPNDTAVNVTFQVLNGSEPVLAFHAIQSIERGGVLAQAVGYEVVENLEIAYYSLTSVSSTMPMSLPISSPLKTPSVTSYSRETSITPSVNSTQRSRTSWTTSESQRSKLLSSTKSLEISQRPSFTPAVSSADVPATPSSQILPSSGAPLVTTNFVVLSSSLMLTVPSKNVSATTSLQTHLSSGAPAVTSSFVALSSALTPSSSEPLITSSVVPIPSGFFVRIGISVPLNQSVNNGTFKNQLEKGIFLAYKNGSMDGISGNVSVNIISIVRLNVSNSTSVNVTFQVLDGSEPLLAYPVVQNIKGATVTLTRAVGYTVILDPIIVYLPSTSISSTMLATSGFSSSFQTTNITRFSTKVSSLEVRQTSSVITFSPTLVATMTDTFVKHATSSIFDSTTQRGLSISPPFNRSSTSTMASLSTFSRSSTSYLTSTLIFKKTSFTVFPSSLFPSRSEVNRNSTVQTTSLSIETVPSSRKVLLSPSSLSLLQSTEAIATPHHSMSYISTKTMSLITSSRSLNGSSVIVLVNSTEMQSIIPAVTSVPFNSSALTSTGSASFTSITPIQTTSIMLSKSLVLTSSLFTHTAIPGNTSLLPATSSEHVTSSSPGIYQNYTTGSSQTSLVFNSTFTLSLSQKSENATTSLAEGSRTIVITRSSAINQTAFLSSTSLDSVSKTHVSGLTPSHETLSSGVVSQTSAFASTPVLPSLNVTVRPLTTFTVSRSKTSPSIPSASNSTQSGLMGSSQTTSSRPLFTPSVSSVESSIQRNSTIHMTFVNVMSSSSIPSSYISAIYISTIRTDVSKSAATYSVVGSTPSSEQSPVSRTRFSDVSTPKVSQTSILSRSVTVDMNITTSSAKTSRLSAVNISTQPDILFSPVSTFILTTPATLMTTRPKTTSVSSYQYHSTERGSSSRSVQPSISSVPKRSSDTIFVIASVTSARNVSNSFTILSSLQTSSYSFQSFSSTLFLGKGLSTTQSLNTTHLSTPEVSGPPLTLSSSTSPKIPTVSPLTRSKPVTYVSSPASMRSRVSSTSSITHGSVGSVVTPVVPFSTSNTSVASHTGKSTPAKPSTSFSSRKSVADSTSRTASRHISFSSSKELSQITRTVSKTVQLLLSSLLMSTVSVKASIVDSLVSDSSIPALTSKSSHILIHSAPSSLLSSVAITVSSAKLISTTPLSVKSISTKTDGLLSTKSTVFAESTPASTSSSSSSRSAKLISSSIVVTKSSLVTLLLPSTPTVIDKSSLLLEISSVFSTLIMSRKSSTTSAIPPVTSLVQSSPLVFASSSLPLTSAKPAITTTTATGLVTTGKPSRATVTITSGIVVRATSPAMSITKTVPLSSVKLPVSTTKEVTTTPTPEKSLSVSRSSTATASVEPTEPIRPTANSNNTEGLVGIQILVPTIVDEKNSSFREDIELKLAAVYRWGQEKGNKRKKRNLEWIDNKLRGTPNWNTRNFELWKRSAAFQVFEKRSRRFRRQVDNIVVLAETIRRAKPIVGEELVDIEYRIFDGLNMLSAEHIVETMNRLSEAELVSTIKYGVTLRPYVVKEIEVTPSPSASRSKWETLIPAIIVPVVVVLFLILAFTWANCASKRKRERQEVKPHKQPPYKNLEIKVLPSHEVIPPPHGLLKKKRSSISSTSSSDIPSKFPTLPVPDYSPGPSESPAKPSQRHRRRTDGKRNDYKRNNSNSSTKDTIYVNGYIEHERAVKKRKDTEDHIEMEQLAGVIENRPQMRDEKLANSLTRSEPPLRFASLPPLIETPLVGPKPSIPDTVAREKNEHDRIIAESGVPQANVERWRNKMRHREKIRQDKREKEREKKKKLKTHETEDKKEKENDVTEDYNSTLQRSLTAERKRRSRLERWRKNRVGTSSSKSSSSSSSSSRSSSESDSDENKKHEKREEKKKKRKAKEKKKKEKLPPLATGQAAKATAQEALRETAWTIRETPGVRLVSVRPRNEVQQQQQSWQETSTEPAHVQNGGQPHNVPPSRPVSSRSQQRDRVHYLLETGYPVLPVMPTPLVQPPAAEYLDYEQPYEDMEGLDPYTAQYDDETYLKDRSIREGVPIEPRQAFGGPSIYEDEHIYEEPMPITPASLPQTHIVSPRENQSRALVPTQYARGYVGRTPVSRGRPTSASQHHGVARPASSARPTSAKMEPMGRYVAPPGRASPPNRSIAPPSIPGSRYMLTNRPTVATAPQPSIGTSPRYMVDPELQKKQPPSSFDGARVILSRAHANVDRFEQDSRVSAPDETDAASVPGHLYAIPQKKGTLQPLTARKEPSHPPSGSRLDLAAKEHAELEAQLLVSRALARARSNVRT